jgi:hypothetical protein
MFAIFDGQIIPVYIYGPQSDVLVYVYNVKLLTHITYLSYFMVTQLKFTLLFILK